MVDKVYHFLAGGLLSSFGLVWAPLFLLGFLAGIGKEIYDSYQPNNKFDFADLIATFIGAFVPMVYSGMIGG